MGTCIFFTAVWNDEQITCGSDTDMRSVAFRLFSLSYFIYHFVFHSL